MKKRIRFIVNPFSGTSRKNNLSKLLENNLNQNLYEYEIKHTKYAGHAIELAKECVDDGIDIVVAVGGDGSVNEVSSSLINSNAVLGIIPGGSGNGFARHLGLSTTPSKAIQVLNSGEVIKVDTCQVNNKAFINVAGIGFDAKIAYLTKKNEKRGFLPYLKTSLQESKNFKPSKLKIVLDGNIIQDEYAAAVVANASMYGYQFTISPLASIKDGKMELMLIKKAKLYQYFLSSYRFLNRSLHRSKYTETYSARKIEIFIEGDDYIHLDGEGYQAKPHLTFEILPLSLNVMVPASRELSFEL